MRDRIKTLLRVRADQIEGAPWNWRRHPEGQQRAVLQSLDELGIYDPLLTREIAPDKYQLIDGHLRHELLDGRIGPGTLIPIIVTDLDEAEAKKANLTHDPLAELATADPGALDRLRAQVPSDKALGELVEKLARDNGLLGKDAADTLTIEEVKVKPPPKMVWLLVGIPLDSYGDVSDAVLLIQGKAGVVVQTTRG